MEYGVYLKDPFHGTWDTTGEILEEGGFDVSGKPWP